MGEAAGSGAAPTAPPEEETEGFFARWVRRFVDLWRRSLQFRVVASTLMLGLTVVSIISFTLYRSIADGLVEDRIDRSQVEARQLADDVESTLEDSTAEPDALRGTAADVLNRSLGTPQGGDWRYAILARSLNNNHNAANEFPAVATNAETIKEIPGPMRESVMRDPDHQQVTTIDFTRPTEGAGSEAADAGESVPAVLVGSQIDIPRAGKYDLYVIYPMDQEERTLSIISRSLMLGAAFLIVLVSGIAYIVTSTVVTPVRRAASAAERLAAGHLNERMSARGHDDLALLGKSFNDMADNLQTQIRQLEGLSRVQQRFVSDVSHELRTPLTTIRMAADVLHASKDELDPVTRRSAELLHDELDRFEELLADLLEISRYDAGAALLEQGPVDVHSIIDRVVESAQSIADARACDVVVHRDPSLDTEAEIDARRIERILRNLVFNAIEHSEGEPVDILVGADEDAVAVVVEDHGVGLKAGEASLVFNRFWRSDPARTRTTGGSGLGLAIALEDARLHQGWLQAWGQPGEGSRFRLTVPRVAGGTLTSSPLPLAPGEDTSVEQQQ
ncbi:MtrAB system histidine kinase MtrB [Janibacter corallicola]|uniref:MtrAB system histidine kinase MtrB n=1 Tax=Janibacter corallicola TaxID=415212 RepID=UPI000A646310|nr:MtrAB system histidine kinase MtrB [Janibacter corallicola]